MIIKIYPQNPNEKAISQVVKILENDGVIIYPTDSVYAFGCSLSSTKAIDKIRTLRAKSGSHFAIVCSSLSTASTYAKINTPQFKLLKRNTPGPFTFLLDAMNKMPDKYLEQKSIVGLRIPDSTIVHAIIEALGSPLVTSSVKLPHLDSEYTTDPSLIYEEYGEKVDALIDGGIGNNSPTTIVDCTKGEEPTIIRQGIGKLII